MLKFCNHYKSLITTVFMYLGQLNNHECIQNLSHPPLHDYYSSNHHYMIIVPLE